MSTKLLEIEQRTVLPREQLQHFLFMLTANYEPLPSQTFKTFLIGGYDGYERIRFNQSEDYFILTTKKGTGEVRTEINKRYNFAEKNLLLPKLIGSSKEFVELRSVRYKFLNNNGLEISLTDHDKIGQILEIEASLEDNAQEQEINAAIEKVRAEMMHLKLTPLNDDDADYKKLWENLFSNNSESITYLADRVNRFN